MALVDRICRSRRAPTEAAQSRSKLARQFRLRVLAVGIAVTSALSAIAGKLCWLASKSDGAFSLSVSEPISATFARPDIVDRNGRLLATDVEVPSLFADPSLVIDRDEVAESLTSVLPELDADELRKSLSDRSRRFVWLKRGLPPAVAQQVHNLGLPGLSFRNELRRAYPGGRTAGHVIGTVDIDNRGVSGIERYIDEVVGTEAVHGATRSDRAPLRLSLDIGVQHSLEDELGRAMRRYGAESAAGLVLDVTTGEVMGSASLPAADPARPSELQDPARLDRISGGTYELGSIFKAVTLAMAFDAGRAGPQTILDVTQPIVEGRFTIKDSHGSGRPLSVAEVFTHSSNVGAAMLALDAGADRHKAFLGKLGLLDQLQTEAGPIAAPQLPERFDRISQITMAYGHGIAVAPLQFAASAAALFNGGELVMPTYVRRLPGSETVRIRALKPATSARINDLMRLNVTDAAGTGKRAEVPGYLVGGKTGTAEIPDSGGYKKSAVISSFLAAFPMNRPQYLILISLFEPKPSAETGGEIAAAVNAAPSAGRLIRRIAPMLGVLPEGTLASAGD